MEWILHQSAARNLLLSVVGLGGFPLFAVTAPAYATTLQIFPKNSPETIVIVGDYHGGVIPASIDGSPNLNPVFCIDFPNGLRRTEVYQISVHPLTNIVGTYFDTVTDWRYSDNATYSATQRYMMAAWLFTQFDFLPSDPVGGSDKNKGVQSAIWKFLNPTTYPVAPTLEPYTSQFISAAERQITLPGFSSPNDGFYSNFQILVPSPTVLTPSPQILMTTTPESSSVMSIIALGTLGAASTIKRQLKSSKSTEKETRKVS